MPYLLHAWDLALSDYWGFGPSKLSPLKKTKKILSLERFPRMKNFFSKKDESFLWNAA